MWTHEKLSLRLIAGRLNGEGQARDETPWSAMAVKRALDRFAPNRTRKA
jgi:hypothetical protein